MAFPSSSQRQANSSLFLNVAIKIKRDNIGNMLAVVPVIEVEFRNENKDDYYSSSNEDCLSNSEPIGDGFKERLTSETDRRTVVFKEAFTP